MNTSPLENGNVKIASSQDVFKIMREVLLREHRLRQLQEYFWVIGLNVSNTKVFLELVGLGTLNRMAVNPLDIFSLATYYKTPKIILVHNHTGNNLKPSKDDIDITARLMKGANTLQVKILDHIIINPDGYYSFKENGQMELVINRMDCV